MKKLMIFLLVSAAAVPVFAAGVTSAGDKKNLIFLVDEGKVGISSGTISILNRYPELKLTVAWPQGMKPSPAVLALVKARRIEPVLTLTDEPALPLLYGVKITTPAIDFSWQQDAWNLIARSQEDYRACFQTYASGLFLRSGLFSGDLVPGLKKLGLSWSTANDITGERKGAFLLDDFVVVSGIRDAAVSPGDFWQMISTRTTPVTVYRFDPENPLTPEMLAAVADGMAASKNFRMITPAELTTELRLLLPVIGQWNGIDVEQWTKRPAVWYKLGLARQAIEDYTNSGAADVRVLEMLRNEIYQLYRYDFLAGVVTGADPDKDRVFMVGLENIYRLMRKPVPPEIGETVDVLPGTAVQQTAPYAELRPGYLGITNPSFGGGPLDIAHFSVTAGSDTITYSIQLGSGTAAHPFYVDLYIDLNNQRGAGFMRLLPGPEAFMREGDAWEYALRFDRYQAALYRAGRVDPVLVKTFMVNRRYVVEIPRALLRGNPRLWGYQAVTMEQLDNAWTIRDFLSGDAKAKETLLRQKPVELPAIRVQR